MPPPQKRIRRSYVLKIFLVVFPISRKNFLVQSKTIKNENWNFGNAILEISKIYWEENSKYLKLNLETLAQNFFKMHCCCLFCVYYNMRVQSRNFCKLNQGSDYQGLILYVCFTVGHFASNITPVSYCGYFSSLIRKSFYR